MDVKSGMDQNSLIKKTLDLLEKHVKSRQISVSNRDVIRKNQSPDELANAFDLTIKDKGASDDDLVRSLGEVLDAGVNTGSPMFMNQMYGHVSDAAIAGDWVTTLLNTSMYTYEVAPLFTLMEQVCIEELCSYIWDGGGDGALTPGGSLSNMEAMVFARNRLFPDSAINGIPAGAKPVIFISDQAHYSFKKGAVFLGFGKNAIVEVVTDNNGSLIPAELEKAVEKAIKKGMTPMMAVGVSGTTVAGVFDNLPEIAAIAGKYNMWFHVDAVYGGSLLFSGKTRHLLSGIELADSVSWNLHKISGIPLVCSAILTKEKGVLNATFTTDADYLFHEEDAAIDLGQKSIQCGRHVDALKLWAAFKKDGREGFEKRVNQMMEGAHLLAQQVKKTPELRLFREPESPIVMFRYESDLKPEVLNELNHQIRNHLFREGRILFNFTHINNSTWLRCVISNPSFGEPEAAATVNEVMRVAEEILSKEYFYSELS